MKQAEIFSIILISLIFVIFCFGFFLGENSSGSGGYDGDLFYIWNNQLTFKNFSLKEAINFTAEYNPKFYQSSKMPMSYILNKYLNPFLFNIENFRLTVFILSCLTPFFLYLTLKEKYTSSNKYDLLLISFFLFLSPYFRTSGYWGLEENYGTLTAIISYYFFYSYKKNENIKEFEVFYKILLFTFFSSLCVYFDQKLLIIPLICYLQIFFSKKRKYEKILVSFFYILFSLPCLYLIYRWKSIMPVSDSIHRNFGQLSFQNIGFTISIFSFYLFPLLFLKEKKFSIREVLYSKLNILILLSTVIYIIYLIFFYETKLLGLGGGAVIKFISLIFNHNSAIKIFFAISLIPSIILILAFFHKNKFDLLILFFFLILSLIISPLYQEYFDPLIVLIALFFFKVPLIINFKNNLIFLSYYFITLIGSIFYYL